MFNLHTNNCTREYSISLSQALEAIRSVRQRGEDREADDMTHVLYLRLIPHDLLEELFEDDPWWSDTLSHNFNCYFFLDEEGNPLERYFVRTLTPEEKLAKFGSDMQWPASWLTGFNKSM